MNSRTAGVPSSNRRRVAIAAAWLALFGVNILGILPWARIGFPAVDLGEMLYEVRRLQLGYVPYKDTFTHHFLGYIVPFYALGWVTALTPAVIKGASLVFNFATAIFVWLTVREVSRASFAWLGAFLAVTVGWFWGWQGFAFNIQSYLAPVLAAAILLAVRAACRAQTASLCACAFLTGVLVTFDQRAAVFLALPAVAFVMTPDLRRPGVAALVSLFATAAPSAAIWYLVRAGAWNDFVDQTMLFPLRYRNTGVPFAIGPIVLTWLGAWPAERIAIPITLAGAVAAWFREPRAAVKTIWIVALGGSAVYALAGGRPFPNYFLIFGPVTIVLMALCPWYLAGRFKLASHAVALGLVVLGLVCALRPLLLVGVTGSAFLRSHEETIETVSTYVRQHTSPEDAVLVWGFAPQIYVMADRFRTFRDAGLLSVAGANFSSTNAADQGRVPRMVAEFDEFLARTPPKAIVVYKLTSEPCFAKGVIQHNLDYERAAHLSGLRDLLARSYRSALVLNGPCEHAEVFVRNVSGR